MFERVLVTGGGGLVGRSIKEVSSLYPQYDFLFSHRSQYDLTVEKEVRNLFEEFKPDYVIHTAAKTGGLKKNLKTPAEQYYHNILINTYVTHYSYLYKVKKLLAFSSVACFDPELEILTEEKLQYGQPHKSFQSYAYTKRMLDIQIDAYNKQYKTNFSSIICGNIFGKHDGFNTEHGHVVPSLIHKCYIAKKDNLPLKVWGDGTPWREFIYSKDLANICLKVLAINKPLPQRIIASGDNPITIRQLVNNICNIFDHKQVQWGRNSFNGNPKRITNKKILMDLLPNFSFTNLNDSLNETISWFIHHYPKVRL